MIDAIDRLKRLAPDSYSYHEHTHFFEPTERNITRVVEVANTITANWEISDEIQQVYKECLEQQNLRV